MHGGPCRVLPASTLSLLLSLQLQGHYQEGCEQRLDRHLHTGACLLRMFLYRDPSTFCDKTQAEALKAETTWWETREGKPLLSLHPQQSPQLIKPCDRPQLTTWRRAAQQTSQLTDSQQIINSCCLKPPRFRLICHPKKNWNNPLTPCAMNM